MVKVKLLVDAEELALEEVVGKVGEEIEVSEEIALALVEEGKAEEVLPPPPEEPKLETQEATPTVPVEPESPTAPEATQEATAPTPEAAKTEEQASTRDADEKPIKQGWAGGHTVGGNNKPMRERHPGL